MEVIGNDGLKKAKLIINQGCSRSFTITHKNSQGNIIDHSNSKGYLALHDDYRNRNVKLDDAVQCSSNVILVSIKPEDTEQLRPGEWSWDLVVEMQGGEKVRLLFGEAEVVDTYALDKDEVKRKCRLP